MVMKKQITKFLFNLILLLTIYATLEIYMVNTSLIDYSHHVDYLFKNNESNMKKKFCSINHQFLTDVSIDDKIKYFGNSDISNYKSSSDEELEYNLIFKSKKNTIYWKVTEDGFVYCTKNCLFAKIKQNKNTENDNYYPLSFVGKNNANLFNKSFLKNYESTSKSLITDSTILQITSDFAKKSDTSLIDDPLKMDNILVCTPYSNQTNYDFLFSISKRSELIGIPEQELIIMFDRTSKLDLNTIRQQLIKMKNQSINGVKVYNRLANYFRLTGNATQAIECFRKALQLEPFNSDVLLNTARLLYKLKFYDDAIYLIKKSLEYVRSDRLPWLQHLTLTEIFKLNGFYEDALIHAKILTRIKPDFKKSLDLIKEIQILLRNRQDKCDRCKNKNINANSNTSIKGFLLDSFKFNSILALFSNVFDSSPSFYLQFSFHMFLILMIFIIGTLFSLLNLLFDTDGKDSIKHDLHKIDSTETNERYNLNKRQQVLQYDTSINYQRKRSNFNLTKKIR